MLVYLGLLVILWIGHLVDLFHLEAQDVSFWEILIYYFFDNFYPVFSDFSLNLNILNY